MHMTAIHQTLTALAGGAANLRLPATLLQTVVQPEALLVLLAAALITVALMLWQLKVRKHEYAEFVRRSAKRDALHERRYRELLDNSSDIVYTHDLEGRVITWSRAGELTTGYTQRDLFGKPLADLVPPSRRESAGRWVAETLAGKAAPVYELLILARDGRPVTLEVTTRTITQEGRLVGILGFARDITARKQTEEAAQRAAEAAEAASRAKSEFLANMSHEIRTPLNGILGMTELTLETHLTAEQREYLELVKLSADSLLIIINDILDFSKIEAGKLELDAEIFDIRRLLATTLKPLELRAREKGVALTWVVDSRVPDRLEGDSVRLRQVMTNLAGNAVKFTEQGSVSVGAELISSDSRTALLRLSVRDTGIGIPRNKQEIIFYAFAQADGSTTRKYGGTGLGLAVTRKIVEMMGGETSLESEPGRGSTFCVTLPFAIPAAAPASRSEIAAGSRASAEVASAGAVSAGATRVLLAEDNPTNQKLVLYLLQRLGYHDIEVVNDGKQALAAVEKSGLDQFSLALMDLQMPEMNGFEATAAIREMERESKHHLPIIALTAHAMKGDMERCLQAGMDGYISKPIRREEFLETIGRFLPSPPKVHPATARKSGILDIPDVLAQLEDDGVVLGELAEIFLQNTPCLLEQISGAISEHDQAALDRAVHALKGSLASFGSVAAFNAVSLLEECTRAKDKTETWQAYDALAFEIERLKPVLAAYVKPESSGAYSS